MQQVVVDKSFQGIGDIQRKCASRLESSRSHIFCAPRDYKPLNVALLDNPITIRETMKGKDVVKWEQVIQKEYHSLVANGM